jgi:predicted phosphohydrolase
MPRVVCISDTHNCGEQIVVPEGDITIHSGDATIQGTIPEIARFNEWFSGLPHRFKIFIAGNHDTLFETNSGLAEALLSDSIVYLRDSAVTIEGLKIYGAPWQPRFFDWAFNLARGAEMAEKWKLIPPDTDVLVTHGPPFEILDLTPSGDNAGCEELRKRIEQIAASGRIKLHVFGHIHLGYGARSLAGIQFANASICDEDYQPVNPPHIFDL